MKKRGRYFNSEKEYFNLYGKKVDRNLPSIHITGSVAGMRKKYWGYECDVVRVGEWIYKVNQN